MSKFYFASDGVPNEHIYVFASRGARDAWLYDSMYGMSKAVNSRYGRRRAEIAGRLYLDESVERDDLPDCTMTNIRWKYDGDYDKWLGCDVARLCVSRGIQSCALETASNDASDSVFESAV